MTTNNVCLVGGSGFIGTRLARRLKISGSSFNIVDREQSTVYQKRWIKGDVRKQTDLRELVPYDCTLVNLAAEHRDDVRPVSRYDEVNVEGAQNLCEVAAEKGIERIVFTSTVAVYGFAPAGTDESGEINYFNDYGRTKWLAEEVYREWQAEDPQRRSLVIIRPTVVFGEQNRGNVYNLLRQIASGRFVMVGNGANRKSMAYVENVAAFLEYSLSFPPGVHVYNYIDKPDFDMNGLVSVVRGLLKSNSRGESNRGFNGWLRLPYALGLAAGYVFDGLALATGRTLPISSIRVKKFCATTQFETSVAKTGFVPPVPLKEGLERTVRHEFLEDHSGKQEFFTE